MYHYKSMLITNVNIFCHHSCMMLIDSNFHIESQSGFFPPKYDMQWLLESCTRLDLPFVSFFFKRDGKSPSAASSTLCTTAFRMDDTCRKASCCEGGCLSAAVFVQLCMTWVIPSWIWLTWHPATLRGCVGHICDGKLLKPHLDVHSVHWIWHNWYSLVGCKTPDFLFHTSFFFFSPLPQKNVSCKLSILAYAHFAFWFVQNYNSAALLGHTGENIETLFIYLFFSGEIFSTVRWANVCWTTKPQVESDPIVCDRSPFKCNLTSFCFTRWLLKWDEVSG